MNDEIKIIADQLMQSGMEMDSAIDEAIRLSRQPSEEDLRLQDLEDQVMGRSRPYKRGERMLRLLDPSQDPLTGERNIRDFGRQKIANIIPGMTLIGREKVFQGHNPLYNLLQEANRVSKAYHGQDYLKELHHRVMQAGRGRVDKDFGYESSFADGGQVFASDTDKIAQKLIEQGLDRETAMAAALRMAQSRQQANESILGGVPTQPPTSDVPPATEILGGDPSRLFQRQPTAMERIRDLPKDVLGAGEALVSMGSLAALAPASMLYALRPGQKTQGDPMEFALRNMYMPRSERGPSHLAGLGEVLESLPQTGPLPELQAFTGVGRGVGRQLVEKGRQAGEAMAPKAGEMMDAYMRRTGMALEMSPEQNLTGTLYETRQEGPFYRVKPRSAQAARPKDRGVREEVRQADPVGGSGGGDVPQPVSDEAISLLIKDPSNFVYRTADDYSQRVTGQRYQLPQMPPSSLAKQSAIGRTFQLAADGDDAYKKSVFEAYGRRYPELVEATGAKNYDQLLEASYRQLAKETADQFRALPVNMSYHRAGEGNYQSSGEMLKDIYGNRHLYVYQGGAPHDFLNAIDPETGLNTNEMFRAIHDFYGHAVHGNPFGPKGEEIAFGAHAQMFSPLARMAMASETRGQNSFVNYTPVNAELKQRINRLNEARYEANRRGQTADVAEIDKLLGEAWQGFQFAPQKSVLLPPEFVDTAYTGGMPGYIQPLIRPEPGTTASEMLTHFSHSPDLQMLDPTRYGTGIKGREMERLLGTQNPVMERSYAYTGDPSRVRPEPGLGRFRYGTRSEGLYDLSADPLLLRTLAAEANRTPFTAKYNKGMADPTQAFTDVERMAKEYGYEGLMNPQQGTAILYHPTPITPFKKGGSVNHKAVASARRALEKAMAKGGEVKMGTGGSMLGTVAGRAAAAAGKKSTQWAQEAAAAKRAPAKSKEEIEAIARRMAAQAQPGFVRASEEQSINPAGKSQLLYEMEQRTPMVVESTIADRPVPNVDYEQQLGKVIVGVPGDPTMGQVAIPGSLDAPTRGGKQLVQVGDVRPETPVQLYGGPRYGANLDETFWASNLSPARAVQNLVQEMAQKYGADQVLGKYIKMSPESSRFAMHNLDALISVLQPEKLDKDKVELLNNLVRKGNPKNKFPEFAGFEDPINVLLQAQMNSKLRKQISEVLEKPSVAKQVGFPFPGKVVQTAITEPELRNVETGVTGFAMGKMNPEGKLSFSSHPTYDYDIPGQAIGRSKYLIPSELSFPDFMAWYRSRPDVQAKVDPINMMKSYGPRQVIDQQYIDEIKMYEEAMKQLTGRKKGGAVKMAGGGALSKAAAAAAKNSKSLREPILINPKSLTFRESDQNRLQEVRNLFPKDTPMNPIVAIQEPDGSLVILDGHNRAVVAAERKQKLPMVSVTRQEYEDLTNRGFDDMEISFAALTRTKQDEAASDLNRQFPGADVGGRGMSAWMNLPDVEEAPVVSGAVKSTDITKRKGGKVGGLSALRK
jgi:hypothetical protein